MRVLRLDALVAGGLLLQLLANPQVQTPIFRPHVTVVPVDVRVFDKTGHPIEDLRDSEFQIFEDGKRQDVVFFSHEVAPAATNPSVMGTVSSFDKVTTSTAEPRAFLLVLGRGRLEGPFKGLTALINFVRTQLSPEDRVGVAAYDRISDLTTDHEAVARLLIRYRDQHEAIENILSNYLRGLITIHWDGVSLLPGIQSKIDQVFQAEGLPRLRRLPMLYGPDDEAFADFRTEMSQLFDHPVAGSSEATRGYQDLRQLFTCAEFMRPVAGEKHLIFVTEQPPNNPKLWIMVDKLALLASDARIAFSTIQTGGLPANFKRADVEALADVIAPRLAQGEDPFPGRTFDEVHSIEAVRAAAKETGGAFSVYEPVANGLRRIAEHAASYYALAYYPPDSKATGAFHKIEVKVTRGDYDLSYRRGYFASDAVASMKSRTAVSRERVNGAYQDFRVLTDIPIGLTARRVGSRLEVSLKIEPSAIQFSEHDGRKTAALEIAAAAGQSGESARGQKQDAVDLSFDPVAFARLTREKITYTTSLDLAGHPHDFEVKVVVYDYLADRAGTAVTKIR